MKCKKMIVSALLAVAVLTGCSLQSTEQTKEEGAQAEAMKQESVAVAEMAETKTVEIINSKGEKIGVATLKEEEKGVRILVEVSKLKPGKHGFHIHEKNFKDTDFDSAGGHFNPTHKEHGLKNPKGHHLGDMHNLEVKSDGTAVQTEFLEQVTLKKDHPHTLIGRSIMIHSDEDDQRSNPAGNSGERIAAGNIVE
ncbi:hypothetical protein BEP19_08190 [Ammoniphilus oxalaticus]|uniref:Superoxide dismutase copper/zinc binding domain-containing protein n=1 Tax=Ammoniphilus oxalaticus TaxID=66863 RepID=A0A419SK03_9BACL|nr:superoxide dismutase family protein [Ammoniphilus oxalaticus]RKD24364.1 hypothetical protein BEP19_08190 [Ammoniphilus oxalaticus]